MDTYHNYNHMLIDYKNDRATQASEIAKTIAGKGGLRVSWRTKDSNICVNFSWMVISDCMTSIAMLTGSDIIMYPKSGLIVFEKSKTFKLSGNAYFCVRVSLV